MKKLIPVLLVLILSNLSFAQQLEIFGYFEPQLMDAKVGSENYQMSSNKLRIDLKYQPSDKVTFAANFDYIAYHGKTQWDILKFLPGHVANEAFSLNYLGYEINPYILPFDDRQFLDNAFLKLSFKLADLTLGKQQLSMGAGYVWNPTDVFNQKDVIDPTYEQPGHNAFRLDMPIKNSFGLTAIYAPTDNWHSTDLLLKLKGRLAHFDLSLLAIQKQWKNSDFRVFDLVSTNFYQLESKRLIFGGDIVGELLGIGVWGEFSKTKVTIKDDDYKNYISYWNQYFTHMPGLPIGQMIYPLNLKNNYYELVIGADYTFDFHTYIMAEFYRNTAAKTEYRNYTLNDWMQFLSAETKTITRDQVYLLINHPLTDLIELGCSTIYSFCDKSAALIPMLTYNVFENVDFTLIGNFYLGEPGAAYATNLGNGGLLRARIYF